MPKRLLIVLFLLFLVGTSEARLTPAHLPQQEWRCDAAYEWDARGRLVGISGPDVAASFKYDALGRRAEKTVNGKTTDYLYDGMDIVQEMEGSLVSAEYLRSLHIDETLGIFGQDGAYYYIHDALGSTIALTDPSSNIIAEYHYDPFGKTTATNPLVHNPFQFAGRENDGGGHLFERNRTYNVELQRYISEDPIGFAGGDINLYVRAANNPVNYVDPLGLISEDEMTYLYRKVSKTGEHQKYGITKDPASRYTAKELAGGKIIILAKGPRKDMLALERELHRSLPLGPQENQCSYFKYQNKKGLRPLKLRGFGNILGIFGLFSTLLDTYEASKIATETGRNPWDVMHEMYGYSHSGDEL